MEVIYVDSLFLLDLVIDYCLLLLSGRVSGVILRRGRYALAALLGAGYAVCMVLPGMVWLGSTPMKLALGVLMALIAFGAETRFWRCAAVFFAVSALFGGAVFAASLLAGAEPLGGVFVSVSLRVLALSFGVCYFAVMRLFNRQGRRAVRAIRTTEITFRGKTAALRALTDTGNALSDPVSGRAVLIAEREALAALLPPDLPENPAEAMVRLSGEGGWRLLPYRTVDTPHALLLCFRPDTVTVDGERADVLVAIGPNRLSADGDFQAILPEAT